jgi:hypothetical protein
MFPTDFVEFGVPAPTVLTDEPDMGQAVALFDYTAAGASSHWNPQNR